MSKVLSFITEYPKWSLVIVLVVIGVTFIGTYTTLKNSERKQEVRRLEIEKDREKKIRDSATISIKKVTKDFSDSLQQILSQDAKIIFKPYKERVYIDRDIDSALIILNSTRYLVQ